MRFILATVIGICSLTAATNQEISFRDFSKIILGEGHSRFESDLMKAFPSKPQYGYTADFAGFIKEFIDYSINRSAIWDVEKIASTLQTVDPQHYDSFKKNVYKVMHGPRYLTAQGSVEFQIALAFNAFVLDNKHRELAPSGYDKLFKESPEFKALEKRLAPGSFQSIALSARPKGALSSAHITAVIAAMTQFSTVQEYEKFTETLLALPHYNSYHYLMAVEALSNIPAKHFTDDFIETFKQYATRYSTSRAPYGLMMAKDVDFDSNIMEQLVAYQTSLK